uniref:DNA repair protein RAD50 n=1 Tax=Rhizophora mucronata TaxID=61149 RepID=A0A2P2LV10_RHIMU
MKLWPDLAFGGNSPVQESFKHSIIVVLPAPLGPTMRVRGLKKVTTCLFSGSKLRMPLISILSTVLILIPPSSLSPTIILYTIYITLLFLVFLKCRAYNQETNTLN